MINILLLKMLILDGQVKNQFNAILDLQKNVKKFVLTHKIVVVMCFSRMVVVIRKYKFNNKNVLL
jgi:hypothetical protein